MTAQNNHRPRVLLLPGAWMGSWIWNPIAHRLRSRGVDATAMTLAGLEADATAERIADIHLADHVDQVTELASSEDRPVVLIAHSYSGMVAAQVADRLGDRVATSVHFDSFLPTDGHSLIDLWGPDETARAQESEDIIDAHYQWAPPPRAALESETGLAPGDRQYLTDRFTPHPGHTVLDPASLRRPVETQHATFVAASASNIPDRLRSDREARWRIHLLSSGHWPMLERPEEVTTLIAEHVLSSNRTL